MAPERSRSTSPGPFDGPAVDKAVFGHLVDGLGAEHTEEACRLFLENATVGIRALRRALDAGDADRAADCAHQLKSASGFVGATRLAALCAAVEAGVPAAGAGDAITVELRRAAAEFDVLVAGIARPGRPTP